MAGRANIWRGLQLALTLALRELRGGLAGFRVFLVCLSLGVAGIAAVGSLGARIDAGLGAQGQVILGGDVAITLSNRPATGPEAAWAATTGAVSAVVDLRALLRAGSAQGLAQVKGVDAAYPLYGTVQIDPAQGLDQALGLRDGLWGLVAAPELAARLGLAPGDRVNLGAGTFEYRGVLTGEPDGASGGFGLGPRVLVRDEGLRAAGLLSPGTLFSTLLRLRLAPGADPDAVRAAGAQVFADTGARWADRRNAAPGVARFVDRVRDFLTLVGLAALVVGGVGIGAAVRGHLARKTRTIAALRTLGASGGLVFAVYLMQIGVIAAFGITIGLGLGAGAVLGTAPLVADAVPLGTGWPVYPGALGRAALFGALAAALFTLWPLAAVRDARPAALLRETGLHGRPKPWVFAAMLVLTAGFGAAVIGLSGAPQLAAWVTGGIGAALVCLRAFGWLGARAARALARRVQGRPGLRLALGALGGPGGDTPNLVMALGLGLGVLAAIGQIDANLQRLIAQEVPKSGPALFALDIQTDQVAAFRALALAQPGVTRVETTPMLRGVVTALDGVPAAQAKVDPDGAWVLRGDRGFSAADRPPEGAVLTAGTWWAEDYAGPPLVSFAAEEAGELGLRIGSTITINILGRPITATVANLRAVNWRELGINFLAIVNARALAGAPLTHLGSVYATDPGPVLSALGREMPGVTPVSVRDQVARVAQGLGLLGAAARWAALGMLVTGLAVLIGAAGARVDAETREAAILKVLGASRALILGSLAWRAALAGALAGVVALAWGGAAAWAVTVFVFEADFAPAPLAALAVVAGGVGLSLAAGLGFAAGPLRRRPARVLREAAG